MINEPFDIRRDTRFAFVLNQTFNAFIKKWPEKYDRLIMIETWASAFANTVLTPESIKMATDYCVKHLKKWPTVYKFKTYCERAAREEALDTPIITKAEEIATRILNSVMKVDKQFSEKLHTYADAFLIAALSVHFAHYNKKNIEYSKAAVEEVSWKFGMFVKEIQSWAEIAEHDEAFWFRSFLDRIR